MTSEEYLKIINNFDLSKYNGIQINYICKQGLNLSEVESLILMKRMLDIGKITQKQYNQYSGGGL